MNAEPVATTTTTTAPPTTKWAIAAVIAGVAIVIGYFALGMPGMDHGVATSVAHDMPGMTVPSARLGELDPQQFQASMANGDAVVINVHVPYEGEIADTDAFIAFDEILESEALPPDLGRPILLYCRTGRMSTIAATTLLEMGYTNVAQLSGGMVAWVESGRSIQQTPR